MGIQVSTPAFTATRLPNGNVRVDGKGNDVTRIYMRVLSLDETHTLILSCNLDDVFDDEITAVLSLI